MTADELAPILAAHAEWLADNTKGKQANLAWANPWGADLADDDLTKATIWPGWAITKEKKS